MSEAKKEVQIKHSDTESGGSSQTERRDLDGLDAAEMTDAELLANYTPGTEEEKKLVRKIDMYMIPILWLMYLLNFVDRTNIVSITNGTFNIENQHCNTLTPHRGMLE